MKIKLGSFLIIIFILLMVMNAVAAEDNTLVGTGEGKLMVDNDNSVLLADANNGNVKLNAIDSQNSLKSGEVGNYTELQNLIDSNPNGIINLEKNYVYSDSDVENSINIPHAITINGNGFYISGANSASSLYIPNTVSNVVLNNISFINGYHNSMLWINGNECIVDNCTFKDNSVDIYGGGAVTIWGYNNTIKNTVFINNTAYDPNYDDNYHIGCGGAIYLKTNSKDNTIDNCTFDNNKAEFGGSLFFDGQNNIVNNSKFINNFANSSGGAVYLFNYGNLIHNSTFENNRANFTAGAVYMYHARNVVDNCTFENNYADVAAGAITMDNEGCVVNNSKFNKNSARHVSGAIYLGVDSNNNKILNSEFNENYVIDDQADGAAIRVDGDNVEILNSEFNKHDSDDGGAIYWLGENGTIKNSKFNENTAKKNGGAIFWQGFNGTIDDCDFNENTANIAGALYIHNSITVKNSNFTKNSADDYAGAIYISADNTTITNSEFNQNYANEAGAIEIYGKNNLIEKSTFAGNKAIGEPEGSQTDFGRGGAILIDESELYKNEEHNNTILDSIFKDNEANKVGGAIHVKSKGNSIKGSEFYYNAANVTGGAVSLYGENNEIDDSLFEHNTAIEGGAVLVYYGNSIINNSIMNYNTAYRGGAIDVFVGKNVIVNNTQFNENKALSEGGAISWLGDDGTIDHSEFNKNYVTGENQSSTYGGAISWIGNNGTINNSKFNDNIASNNGNFSAGGAVHIKGSNVSVEYSTFENNVAGWYGGAIHWIGDNGTLYNSTFTGNNASTQGGALYDNGNNFIINESTFTDNHAFFLGGALALEGTGTIDNSKFIENTANKGGAIYWDAPDGTLNNSYFHKNSAKYAGGAISCDYTYPKSKKLIQNSVFEENSCVNYGGAIATLNADIVGSTFKDNKANVGEAIHAYSSKIENSTLTNNDAVVQTTELIEINQDDIIGNSTRRTNTSYIAMCVERYTNFPHLGLKDDSLDRLVNILNGTPIADYLKILIFTYFNSTDDAYKFAGQTIDFYPEAYRDDPDRDNHKEPIPLIDYYSRAVHEFSDHEFWNSTHPVVHKVLELYETVYGNGTKMPEKFIKEINGVTIEYDFSSMISPTSQSLVMFRMIPVPKLDKTYLNSTEFINVNDTVAFNITINNTGDKPLVNVTINEIFNSTELEYIGHSDNKTWIKNNNTFIYTKDPAVGDIVIYNVILNNTGDSILENIEFRNVYDSTQLEFVKCDNSALVRNGETFIFNDKVKALKSQTLSLFFKVLTKELNLAVMTPEIVKYDISKKNNILAKDPKISIESEYAGRFSPINVGETVTFTVWFKTLTNGTLVNNVSLNAVATKEQMASNNTEVFKPVTVNVIKVWNDSENQDGIRNASVTVVLLADGKDINSAVLDDSNNWTAVFSGLPAYKNNGAVIVYTVVEADVPAGYTVNVTSDDLGNWTVTNTHVPDVTDVSVVKVWNDSDNQDGIRNASVTVVLLADGDMINSTVLNAANNWKFTFTDLPARKNGALINYAVAETDVPAGYTVNVTSDDLGNWTVTNTHVPDVTDVSVVKVWNDSDNQDGIRNASVTVVLLADGDMINSTVLNAANNWKFTFTDLPARKNGALINYAVAETDVPAGYTVNVTSDDLGNWTVTNTHVPDVTDVSVVKVWNDADDQDGVRPSEIIVVLKADGDVVGTATLNASNGWSASFTGLPVYNAGNVIEYSVDEVDVANYTSVVSADGQYSFIVNNTHVPLVTVVDVVKVWNDNDNQDGVRPSEIIVVLKADGDVVGTATLNASNGWSASFSDLPVNKAGKVIVYSVDEVDVANYTSVVSADGQYSFIVNNTHVPLVTVVDVVKVWNDNDNQDGVRPSEIIVVLKADGDIVDTTTLNANNNWSASFRGLSVYKNNGTLIEYSVEELVVANYTSIVSADSAYSFTINNVHNPAVTVVDVAKVWSDNDNQDGVRPASVTVVLKADGNVVGTATLNAYNNWHASFENLPVYSNAQVIEYSVEEVSVANYTSVVSADSAYSFTINNVHNPVVTVVDVAKVWSDNDNQDGVRPASVTVVLKADGNVVGTATLNANNNWRSTFTDLPVYDNGKVIVYSVEELDVASYSAVISNNGEFSFIVTNVHVPETTSVNVTKVWSDNNNQDGIRPSSITVVLVADGNVINSAVLNDGNSWKATFADLPVYSNGNVIAYSIEEVSVANYTTVISNAGAYDFIVNNTHIPVITSVNITKVWKDTEEKEKTSVPIEVIIYADGVPVANATLFPGNDWKLSIDDLPVYHDGKVINYTIGVIENNHTTNISADDGNFTILDEPVLHPDMSVRKITLDTQVEVGDIVSFVIVVENTGDCELTGVYVIDNDYSDGLEYLYMESDDDWIDEGDGRFTLARTLGIGESASLTVVFEATSAGFKVNNVTAGNNLTNETVKSSNTTNVTEEVPEPDVPVVPDVPHKHHVPKHVKPDTHATGNPIVLLLLALFVPLLRRKQK